MAAIDAAADAGHPTLNFRLPAAVRCRPLLAAWLAFATYSTAVAVLVQFVVLPLLLPGLHAGHGLLLNTDAVTYHEIATALAERITRYGWSAWTLVPQGQPAAGLATPFYVLIAPAPWSLIPVNAVLHATAGVIVVQMLRELDVDWAIGLAGGTLWVIFPSSLQWVAQIQKDGYFFAGALATLLGALWLLQIARGRRPATTIPTAGALVVAGIAAAGLARTQGFQLMQLLTAIPAAIAIVVVVADYWRRRSLHRFAFVTASALVIVPVLLALAPRDVRWDPVTSATGGPSAPAAEMIAGRPWETSPLLPAVVDRALLRIAIARRAYLSASYAGAGSMIDLDVQFHHWDEIPAYLPRAAQIGLFAPFPSRWLATDTGQSGAIMRLVAAFEMVPLYLLLSAGLVLAIVRWRSRLEFWVIFSTCFFFIVIYSCATPNLGTLYRLRYGFLMTLAALGLAAIWQTLRERAAQRRPA